MEYDRQHPVDPCDFTGITRYPEHCRTTVWLKERFLPDYSVERMKWLVFGQANFQHFECSNIWMVKSYLEGATDFEHDSAHALWLPITGLQFDQLFYHTTIFTGTILSPDPESDFRVPLPDYDPRKLPETVECTHKDCKDEPHLIVPEDFYVPPHDPELYKKVMGLQVEIRVSTVIPKEE